MTLHQSVTPAAMRSMQTSFWHGIASAILGGAADEKGEGGRMHP